MVSPHALQACLAYVCAVGEHCTSSYALCSGCWTLALCPSASVSALHYINKIARQPPRPRPRPSCRVTSHRGAGICFADSGRQISPFPTLRSFLKHTDQVRGRLGLLTDLCILI